MDKINSDPLNPAPIPEPEVAATPVVQDPPKSAKPDPYMQVTQEPVRYQQEPIKPPQKQSVVYDPQESLDRPVEFAPKRQDGQSPALAGHEETSKTLLSIDGISRAAGFIADRVSMSDAESLQSIKDFSDTLGLDVNNSDFGMIGRGVKKTLNMGAMAVYGAGRGLLEGVEAGASGADLAARWIGLSGFKPVRFDIPGRDQYGIKVGNERGVYRDLAPVGIPGLIGDLASYAPMMIATNVASVAAIRTGGSLLAASGRLRAAERFVEAGTRIVTGTSLEGRVAALKGASGFWKTSQKIGLNSAQWLHQYLAREAPAEFLFQRGDSGRVTDLSWTLFGTEAEKVVSGWLSEDPGELDGAGRTIRRDSFSGRLKNVLSGIIMEPAFDASFHLVLEAPNIAKKAQLEVTDRLVSRYAIDGKSPLHNWLFEVTTKAGDTRRKIRDAIVSGTPEAAHEAAQASIEYGRLASTMDYVPGSATSRSGPALPDMTPETYSKLKGALDSAPMVIMKTSPDGTLEAGFVPNNHHYVEVHKVSMSEAEFSSMPGSESASRLGIDTEMRDRTDFVGISKSGDGSLTIGVYKIVPDIGDADGLARAMEVAIREGRGVIRTFLPGPDGKASVRELSVNDVLAGKSRQVSPAVRARLLEVFNVKANGVDGSIVFSDGDHLFNSVPNYDGASARGQRNAKATKRGDVDPAEFAVDVNSTSYSRDGYGVVDPTTIHVVSADPAALDAEYRKWIASPEVQALLLADKNNHVSVKYANGRAMLMVAMNTPDIGDALRLTQETRSGLILNKTGDIDIRNGNFGVVRKELRRSARGKVIEYLRRINRIDENSPRLEDESISNGVFGRGRLGDVAGIVMQALDPVLDYVQLEVLGTTGAPDALGAYDRFSRVIEVVASAEGFLRDQQPLRQGSGVTTSPILHEAFHAVLDLTLSLPGMNPAKQSAVKAALWKSHAKVVSEILSGTFKLDGKVMPKELVASVSKHLGGMRKNLLDNGKAAVLDTELKIVMNGTFAEGYQAIIADVTALVDKKVISPADARDFMAAVHGMASPQEAMIFELFRTGPDGIKKALNLDGLSKDEGASYSSFFGKMARTVEAFFSVNRDLHGPYVNNTVVQAVRDAYEAHYNRPVMSTIDDVAGFSYLKDIAQGVKVFNQIGFLEGGTEQLRNLDKMAHEMFSDSLDPDMLDILDHLSDGTARRRLLENGREEIVLNPRVSKELIGRAFQAKWLTENGILVKDMRGKFPLQGPKVAARLKGGQTVVLREHNPADVINGVRPSAHELASAMTRSLDDRPFHNGFSFDPTTISPERFVEALSQMDGAPTVTVWPSSHYDNHVLILSNDVGPNGLPIAGIAIRKDGYVESLFNASKDPSKAGMGLEAMYAAMSIFDPGSGTPAHVRKFHEQTFGKPEARTTPLVINADAYNWHQKGEKYSSYISALLDAGFKITSTSNWNPELAGPAMVAHVSSHKTRTKSPKYVELEYKSGASVFAKNQQIIEAARSQAASKMADTMFRRVEFINRYDNTAGQTRWYKDSINKTFELASKFYPELQRPSANASPEAHLAFDDARRTFTTLLAVFSPNSSPTLNIRNALEAYRGFRATGVAPGALDPTFHGSANALHPTGPGNNARRFNLLVDAAIDEWVKANPGSEMMRTTRPTGQQLLRVVGSLLRGFEMDTTKASEKDLVVWMQRLQEFSEKVLGTSKEIFSLGKSGMSGVLVGPKAKEWGGFNADYFMVPHKEGAKPLSQITGLDFLDYSTIQNVGMFSGKDGKWIAEVKGADGSVDEAASRVATTELIRGVYESEGAKFDASHYHDGRSGGGEPTLIVETSDAIPEVNLTRIAKRLKQYAIAQATTKGAYTGQGVKGFFKLDSNGRLVLSRFRALKSVGLDLAYGPKVGAFSRNMLGLFDYFTQDLWSGIESRRHLGSNTEMDFNSVASTKEVRGSSPDVRDPVREPSFDAAIETAAKFQQDVGDYPEHVRRDVEVADIQAILWNATQTYVQRHGQNTGHRASPNFSDSMGDVLLAHGRDLVDAGHLTQQQLDQVAVEIASEGKAVPNTPAEFYRGRTAEDGSPSSIGWDPAGARISAPGETNLLDPARINLTRRAPGTTNRARLNPVDRPFGSGRSHSLNPLFDPEVRKEIQHYQDRMAGEGLEPDKITPNLHKEDIELAMAGLENSILDGNKVLPDEPSLGPVDLAKRIPASIPERLEKARADFTRSAEEFAADTGQDPSKALVDILKTKTSIDKRGVLIDGKWHKMGSVSDIDLLPPAAQAEMLKRINMVMVVRKKSLMDSGKRLAGFLEQLQSRGVGDIETNPEALSMDDKVALMRLLNEVLFHRTSYRALSSESGRGLSSLRGSVFRRLTLDALEPGLPERTIPDPATPTTALPDTVAPALEGPGKPSDTSGPKLDSTAAPKAGSAAEAPTDLIDTDMETLKPGPEAAAVTSDAAKAVSAADRLLEKIEAIDQTRTRGEAAKDGRKIDKLSSQVTKLLTALKEERGLTKLAVKEIDRINSDLEKAQLDLIAAEDERNAAVDLGDAAEKARRALDRRNEVQEKRHTEALEKRDAAIKELKKVLLQRKKDLTNLGNRVSVLESLNAKKDQALKDEKAKTRQLLKQLGAADARTVLSPDDFRDVVKLAKRFAAASGTGANVASGLLFHPVNNFLSGFIATNLLYNPLTSTKNILGNTANLLFKATQMTVGGLVSANPDGVKYSLRYWSNLFSSLQEVAGIAKDSFVKNEKYFNSDDLMPEAQPGLFSTLKENGHPVLTYMDSVHQIFNRFNGAADEFFVQLAFRAHMKSRYMMAAIQSGAANPGMVAERMYNRTLGDRYKSVDEKFLKLSQTAAERTVGQRLLSNGIQADTPEYQQAVQAEATKQFIQLVRDHVSDYTGVPTTDTNALLKKWDQLDQEMKGAEYMARQVTFTEDPLRPDTIWSGAKHVVNRAKRGKPGQGLGDTVAGVAAAFIAPFMAVPGNIVKQGMQETWSPVTSLLDFVRTPSQRFSGDDAWKNDFDNALKSPDAAIRSKAIGSLVLAATAWAVVGINAAEGNVTGGGPLDEEERRKWLLSNKPYHIKQPDGSWRPYMWAEPVAGLIAQVADISYFAKNGWAVEDGQQSLVDNAVKPMMAAVLRSTLDKSMATGLNDFLEMANAPLSGKSERYFGNMSRGVIPGSGIALNYQNATDKDLRVLDEVRDYWYSRYVARNEIQRRRDVTGRVVKNPDTKSTGSEAMDFVSAMNLMLNPMAERKGKDTDALSQELSDNSINDEMTAAVPGTAAFKHMSGVKLTDLGPKSDTVYDRLGRKMAESGGRQRMLDMITSPDYKSLAAGQTFGSVRSPRNKTLARGLDSIRDEAWNQLMAEDKDLQQLYNAFPRDTSGRSRKEVEAIVQKLVGTYNQRKGR